MSLMPTIDDSYLSVSVRGCSSMFADVLYHNDYKENVCFPCSPLFMVVRPCTVIGVVNGVVNFEQRERKHEQGNTQTKRQPFKKTKRITSRKSHLIQ